MHLATGKRSAGYIDNRPVIWIVLILAAVAVPNFIELKTGKGIVEQFWSLAYPWPAFLLTLAGVIALGFLALVLGAWLWRGTPYYVSRESDRVSLREREAAQLIGGVAVAGVALTLIAFGIIGPGWFWGLVAAAGMFLLIIAVALLSHRVTWEFTRDAITRHERTFGAPRIEHWSLPEQPLFETAEFTSGGAFGQPSVVLHSVRLGEQKLLETDDEARATAFLEALREAYPPAGGNA